MLCGGDRAPETHDQPALTVGASPVCVFMTSAEGGTFLCHCEGSYDLPLRVIVGLTC